MAGLLALGRSRPLSWRARAALALVAAKTLNDSNYKLKLRSLARPKAGVDQLIIVRVITSPNAGHGVCTLPSSRPASQLVGQPAG